MAHPEPDDVVIRQQDGNPSTVYLLGTPATLDQFILRIRDKAVSQSPRVCKASARPGVVYQRRRDLRVARHVPRRSAGGTGEVNGRHERWHVKEAE